MFAAVEPSILSPLVRALIGGASVVAGVACGGVAENDPFPDRERGESAVDLGTDDSRPVAGDRANQVVSLCLAAEQTVEAQCGVVTDLECELIVMVADELSCLETLGATLRCSTREPCQFPPLTCQATIDAHLSCQSRGEIPPPPE